MIKFNNKQALWIMDFFGNRLVAINIILNNIKNEENIDEITFRHAFDDMIRIRKFLNNISKRI